MADMVVSAVGAAIGFVASGGSPWGAQLGWMAGSAIGGQMFAKSPAAAPAQMMSYQSQAMMDLKIMGTEYGQCIPYVHGRARVAGQIWWNSDRRPTATTTVSGNLSITTITYDMDLLIGLTNNQIAGVARIWNNGKLVYTASADSSEASIAASALAAGWTRMTVYTGASNQLPDPTYEAAVGSANACAYRGRGSIFIAGLQLGQSGQVPNITCEVITEGETIQYEALSLCHFDGAAGATTTTDEVATNTVTLTTATLDASAKFGTTSLGINGTSANASIAGITTGHTAPWTAEFWFGHPDIATAFKYMLLSAGTSDKAISLEASRTALFLTLGNVSAGDIVNAASVAITVVANQWHHVALVWTGVTYYTYFDGVVKHTVASALPVFGFDALRLGASLAGGNAKNGSGFDDFRLAAGVVYPGGSTFTPPTSAHSNGPIDSIVAVPPTVAETITELCERAGLTASQIDVTELSSLTREVESLAITQVIPTRNTLEALMSAFFFEMVTSDKIYFIPRGGSSVETIPYEDLGASMGDQPDEPLALKQANEIEVPAQIALTYTNLDADYQADTQYSDRIITATAGTVSTLTMAIGMTPSEAKSVADVILMDQAASVIGTSIALLGDYCHLEPTDPVTLTGSDGSTFRMRLTKKTDSYPLLRFDCVLDDVSVLTSQGITSADYTSSTTVAAPVTTVMELMDIPILLDDDNDAGFYAAVHGSDTPFPGASLYSSNDGVTYSVYLAAMVSTVFGECTTTLGDWTGPRVIDELNTVTVDVGDGTLSSSTRDTILSSATTNLILIGDEVIQFITATLVSPGIYTLSRLLRGCRGTEWAMTGHVPPGSPPVGERAVLLSGSGLRRGSMSSVDLGISKYYKPVTTGRALGTATAEQFTNNAVGLKPFSPFDLRASRDGSNNVTFTWQRRTRLAVRTIGALGISIPLGEDSESYEIDIFASSAYSAVLRTITATTTTASYTAAEQTTDGLTPGNPVYARVYQISATVLRGYELESVA